MPHAAGRIVHRAPSRAALTRIDTTVDAARGLLSRARSRDRVIFADHITIDETAESAEASLFVDPDAEFLRDHFPGRPILPGLVMLESAVRTATALWIARRREAAFGVVLDRLARLHVMRGVEAGDTLTLRAHLVATDDAGDHATWVQALGLVDGAMAVRMRFRLRRLREGETRWSAQGGTDDDAR